MLNAAVKSSEINYRNSSISRPIERTMHQTKALRRKENNRTSNLGKQLLNEQEKIFTLQ